MHIGLIGRLFLRILVVFVGFGFITVNSFAAENVKGLELSKALNQIKLFSGLTDKERTALKQIATLRYCKEGEHIIEQGKSLDRMFIILGGKAEVKVNGEVVATLPNQSLTGELEFLDKLPARADVIIVKETRLIELNSADLSSLMEKQPRLGYVLMSGIARIEAQRLRAMNQK